MKGKSKGSAEKTIEGVGNVALRQAESHLSYTTLFTAASSVIFNPRISLNLQLTRQ